MECCFCGNQRIKLFESLGLPSTDAILYEDENIIMTPDLVPVTCGHLLIITKRHISCFGEADKNTLNSLNMVKRFVKNTIFFNREVLFFEHGSVIPHSGGGCIDHAHLHAVPLFDPICMEKIDSFISESDFVPDKKIAANENILADFYNKKQPYIFYEIEKEKWVYPVKTLPSQFLKMLFAPYMSYSYNWKISYKTKESNEFFLKTLQLAKDNILLMKNKMVNKENALPINKLVRDNIVNIIKSEGRRVEYSILNTDKYIKELNKKLLEECKEFIQANDKKELADLLEVILSISKIKHFDMSEIEEIRLKKLETNGGFEKRIFLEFAEQK
ncbi:hypothetical protein AGMMS50212_11630 [Spirochaetia bacterium]|nr:hypothetical protein AGMMS50212_11630 [Spirochaetia bacterium]